MALLAPPQLPLANFGSTLFRGAMASSHPLGRQNHRSDAAYPHGFSRRFQILPSRRCRPIREPFSTSTSFPFGEGYEHRHQARQLRGYHRRLLVRRPSPVLSGEALGNTDLIYHTMDYRCRRRYRRRTPCSTSSLQTLRRRLARSSSQASALCSPASACPGTARFVTSSAA